MPAGRKKGEGPVVARVSAGGGMSPIAWGVGILGCSRCSSTASGSSAAETRAGGAAGGRPRRAAQSFGSVTPTWPWYLPALSL
jgi:hypothetical protein